MSTIEAYDLFIKKIASSPEAAALALPLQPGAAGVSLDLQEARELKKTIRAHGGVAVVFPLSYRAPNYSYQAALAIATPAYQALVAASPSNYGPLELYDENPVYWLFSADNYALQAEGYSPGRTAFFVDKLTGELLTESELKARFYSLQ